MPSATVEDYLKTLYKLEQRSSGRVKTKQVADALGVSQPSVTTMMKSLAERGFITYESYRGFLLTDRGRRAALRVIRNHRLIEVFLIEVLGFTWDEVHLEAERLEHAMSERLTDRIDAFLGYPQYDPHGDPIPGRDGKMAERASQSLLEVAPGSALVISRVMDQSSEVLQYLSELGLRPGTALGLQRIDPFDGPVWLLVEGSEIALSRTLAARIQVTPSTAASDV